MNVLQVFVRYGSWPILFFGMSALIIYTGAVDAGLIAMFGILILAISFTFLSERLLPYQKAWNKPLDDQLRDFFHAIVNTLLNRLLLFCLPILAALGFTGYWWPTNWPYLLQVLSAVIVLDFCIAAAHHASHKSRILWSFHAVHHSAKRLYGFNGLMKHPAHQLFEVAVAIIPLLIIGIPYSVAITLPFLVSIALLAQHSNVDSVSGPFKFIFANSEVHRFHHTNGKSGDINFGLFTNFYDHIFKTFYYKKGDAPRSSAEVGIRGDEKYPSSYLKQIIRPFIELQRNS